MAKPQTIHFELSKSIKYAGSDGNEIECNFIELLEPTGKVSHLCCAIEGIIQSGVMKMAEMLDQDEIEAAKETAKNNAESEKDGDAVLALMAGSGVDMEKLVLHFRELFKSVAWMGAEKLITTARLDELSHSDLRKMMGVYAANFILN